MKKNINIFGMVLVALVILGIVSGFTKSQAKEKVNEVKKEVCNFDYQIESWEFASIEEMRTIDEHIYALIGENEKHIYCDSKTVCECYGDECVVEFIYETDAQTIIVHALNKAPRIG